VVANDDGSIEVVTAQDKVHSVAEAMTRAGLEPLGVETTQRAAADAPLAGGDAEAMLKLLEALDDLDDVQNVHTNAVFPDSLMERQAS
jgi:transcriptional/translational regulatory protein YebC/TACO1